MEDRNEVRTVTCGMLERLGYSPIGAANGAEAMAMASRHEGPIPLLLTDVVMPGLNGREVAELLVRTYPQMRVIFMSGHSGRILTETDKLDPSIVYLQKPFTLAQLAEVLQRAKGQSDGPPISALRTFTKLNGNSRRPHAGKFLTLIPGGNASVTGRSSGA